MKAKVKTDTLFKRHPVLSSELTDAEKQVVLTGTEHELKLFTEAAHDHWRLELADDALANQPMATWFVHKADVAIVGDGVTVTTTADTVFKQRPVLSSELMDHEKAFIKAGREFALQSYAPAPSGYTKLSLAEARLGDGNVKDWYAIADDITISGQQITLRVLNDTLFKTKPVLAKQLAADEKELVTKHTTLALQTYTEVEGNYLKVTLAGSSMGAADRLTWYVFASDIEIAGTAPSDCPVDDNVASQPQTGDRGQPLNLPGFPGTYFLNDSIMPGGYFTWAQATHGGTRIPASAQVVYGIIRIAEVMEEIRGLLDNQAIAIHSWYRDPATNLRVGGWAMSRHLHGDAVNFSVEGVSPADVYTRLDDWWGSQGGLASSTQFTHIDARGYQARWQYRH